MEEVHVLDKTPEKILQLDCESKWELDDNQASDHDIAPTATNCNVAPGLDGHL